MDGPGINQKIRFGYAKAAQKLGQDFSLYRANTPINPIQDGNLIGTIKAVMTVDWSWMKANKPGNAIWFCCIDGQDISDPLSAQESDYLVGDKTFFVLSKEYQLPIQVMECNRVLSISRPTQSNTAGPQGYVGILPSTSETVMTAMPASVLKYGKNIKADTKLPSDTNEPDWIIQIPNIGGVNIRIGDLITDEINEQYVVNVNEETEFGWRLIATQAVNSR